MRSCAARCGSRIARGRGLMVVGAVIATLGRDVLVTLYLSGV